MLSWRGLLLLGSDLLRSLLLQNVIELVNSVLHLLNLVLSQSDLSRANLALVAKQLLVLLPLLQVGQVALESITLRNGHLNHSIVPRLLIQLRLLELLSLLRREFGLLLTPVLQLRVVLRKQGRVLVLSPLLA